MSKTHENPKSPKRVAEPVQVYLDPTERDRLDRLAAQLETSKSAVLRQALEALERELTDPATHPALQLIGLAGAEAHGTSALDPASDHDQILADSEVDSWDHLSGSAGG
jgi:predicted transcriptional regulator